MIYEPQLEPKDVWAPDCCEADDCADGCNCENHGCDECGISHGCRCDADFDAWEDMGYDFD